ncbi:type II toxin-antitoxin system RelE/ParE family toxin [Pelagibacterium nitratireducens]|uniref:Type II toxin-antitoxin system RelE/ParE family toxin n=1 Tax=Pelagibacterium nitratireducens TaxID=1046114 RepID=A0ABZ2I226_9HYPH
MIQGTKGKLAANAVDDIFWQRLSRRSGEANTRNAVRADAASALQDMCFPPGNGLEAMSGDREGEHLVRITFVRTGQGPANVEIVDYH